MFEERFKDRLNPRTQGLEKATENWKQLFEGLSHLAVDMAEFRKQQERLAARIRTEFDDILNHAIEERLIPDYLLEPLLLNSLLQEAFLHFLEGAPQQINHPDDMPLRLHASLRDVIDKKLQTDPNCGQYDVLGDGSRLIDLPKLVKAVDEEILVPSDLWQAVEEPQEYRILLKQIERAQFEKDFGPE